MSAVNVDAILDAIELSLGAPTGEHVVETHGIAQAADARWERARQGRLAVAERIADCAASGREIDPRDLSTYRQLHEVQVEARRARSLAVDELLRVLPASDA